MTWVYTLYNPILKLFARADVDWGPLHQNGWLSEYVLKFDSAKEAREFLQEYSHCHEPYTVVRRVCV